MKQRIDFVPVPGTRGYISANGIELVVTHGDLETLKKNCTVANKGALYLYRQTTRAIGFYEGKIEQLNKEHGSGTQQALKLEELVETKRKEAAELKTQLKKEYWAVKDDGTLSLPSGFWWMIEKIDGDAHLNSDIQYAEIPVLGGKEPREYQREVCRALLKYKRASTVMATGTGKGLMIAMMAWSLVAAGKRVVVIVPTIELVDQTYEIMKKYFKKISATGGSFKFKPGSEVLVTTIGSAMKHIDIFDAVLVDEFHHSAATTYNDALFQALSARYFYGFTACPTRADGMSLGIHAACGPIVYEKSTRWAIENGFLVKAKIVIVQVTGLGQWKKDSRHVQVYKQAMKNPKTLSVINRLIEQSISKGKNTLVLFRTVQAGKEASRWAGENSTAKYHVASAQFRNPLRQFRKKETKLLVANSALCGEGVDLPNIDGMVSACQVASENMTRQIIGRGLRLATGKTELVFVDVVVMGFEPFERAAVEREKIYREFTDDIRYIRA